MRDLPSDMCHISYALKLIDVVHFIALDQDKENMEKINKFGEFIDFFNKVTGRTVMADITLQTKNDQFAKKLHRRFGTSLRVRRAFSDGAFGHLGYEKNVLGLYTTNIHYDFRYGSDDPE